MSTYPIKHGLITAILFILVTTSLQATAEDKIKSFKDWGYKCEQPQGSDKEICFIFQIVTSEKDDKRIAHTTIAYLPKIDEPVMVITLPLGVFLPAGIKLQVDDAEKEAVRAQFIQCSQDGCQAKAQMNDKLIAKMKGGKRMVVVFMTPQQKQLGFPISLSGFTAAFNSLKK